MARGLAIFKHILVPTDGSEPSIAAGKLAIQLATVHQARMTLVYVVDDRAVSRLAGAAGKRPEQVHEELAATGQRYVDYLARLATAVGMQAARVVLSGVPHSEIVRLAREQNVDLIVMGHIGSTGPRRILIGSVTERVIEHAPCPVLVAGKN